MTPVKSSPVLQRGGYDFTREEKTIDSSRVHQRLKPKNENSKNSKYLNGSKSFNDQNDRPRCHSEQMLFSRRKSPSMSGSRLFDLFFFSLLVFSVPYEQDKLYVFTEAFRCICIHKC